MANERNMSTLELMALTYAIKQIGIFKTNYFNIGSECIVKTINEAYSAVYADRTAGYFQPDEELEVFKGVIANTLEDLLDLDDTSAEILWRDFDDQKLDDLLYYCDDLDAVTKKYGIEAINADKVNQKAKAAAERQKMQTVRQSNMAATINAVKNVNAATATPKTTYTGRSNMFVGSGTAKDSKYRLANLSLDYLLSEFYSDAYSKLQDAISDGTMDQRLQESADAKCDGNVRQCAKSLYNSLASLKTHALNDYSGVAQQKRLEFLDVMTPWVNSWLSGRTGNIKKTQRLELGSAVLDGSGRPEYDLTDEEVEALAGNYEKIRRTINNMSSALKFDRVISNTALYTKILYQRDRLHVLKNEAKPIIGGYTEDVKKSALDKLNRKATEAFTEEESDMLRLLLTSIK